KTLAVTIPASSTTPHCFTQLDAFTGQPLPAITDTDMYGSRLLASQFGEVATCAEVGGETQSQPPPTETTETTEVTTLPPAEVEAVGITRAAAATTATTAAVRPAVLPRTGPPNRVEPLLAASGWLLILGGSLI